MGERGRSLIALGKSSVQREWPRRRKSGFEAVVRRIEPLVCVGPILGLENVAHHGVVHTSAVSHPEPHGPAGPRRQAREIIRATFFKVCTNGQTSKLTPASPTGLR